MAYPQVAILNEASEISDNMAGRIGWALRYQLYYHFAPVWKSWANVKNLPKGASIPSDAWVLALLDNADQEGALGYHDESGAEAPFARVFCKTAREGGIAPCEVASHELLEMLLDPHVNFTALDEKHKRLYPVEACDACQGNGYGVGAAGNQLTVADFLLPNYFDPKTKPSTITDYRDALKGPFSLAREGYYSYIDLTNYAAGWQQKVGAEYKGERPVDLDDRLSRRNQTMVFK